ncbi:MAG: Gfo/Idh/MocA family oxidoreductase [Phycisphaerae bacterium]|nr:Gfo/Idh/MocA family oxidoreductase [Phycisphaerae bacterium]
MSRAQPMTRRGFLKRAGLVAVAAPWLVPRTVLGTPARRAPSERVTLGIIGLKKMGREHVRNLLGHGGVQILAVCDVDTTARNEAQHQVEETYGAAQRDGHYTGCAAYNEYERIMERADIDAVVLAVPEHWHAIMAIAACRAGKDVYCEKPLSLTIREAQEMVRVARRYGTVFQTGSQQRSSANFRLACELVRSGRIGEVKTVNVGVGPPSTEIYLPEEPVPPGLDYERWLGPAPWKPYHHLRCGSYYEDGWRRIRDYSGGKMTDWGAHHFDIAQWGLGMDGSGPVEIIPPNGQTGAPLTYRYANGVLVQHGGADGVLFTGTEGKLEVNRDHLTTWPASIRKSPLGPNEVHLYESRGHYEDWLHCIRTRGRPICDVAIGATSVIVCHLGNIAWWLGRTLHWDPARQELVGDDIAARWLDRPKRAPYRL